MANYYSVVIIEEDSEPMLEGGYLSQLEMSNMQSIRASKMWIN